MFVHRFGGFGGRVDKYPDAGYFTITGHRGQSVVAGTHDETDIMSQALPCGPKHEWLPGIPMVSQREILIRSVQSYLGSKLQSEFRDFEREYRELVRKGSITCLWSNTDTSNVSYTRVGNHAVKDLGIVHFKNQSRKPYPDNLSDIAGPSSTFVKFLMSLRALHVAGASRTWIGYLSKITQAIDRNLLTERNLISQLFTNRFSGGLGPYFEGTETDTACVRHYTQFFSSKAVEAVCEAFRTLESVCNTLMMDVKSPLTVKVYLRREPIKLKTASELSFQFNASVESFTISKLRCLADYPNLHRRYSEVLATQHTPKTALSMNGVEVDETKTEEELIAAAAASAATASTSSTTSSSSKSSSKKTSTSDSDADAKKDGWIIGLDTIESLPFRKACFYFNFPTSRNTLESVIHALGTDTFARKHKQKINVYAPTQQAASRGSSQIELLQRQLDLLKEGHGGQSTSNQQLLVQLQLQLNQLQQKQW